MAAFRRRWAPQKLSVFSPRRFLSAPTTPQFWEACGLLNLRGDEDLAAVKRAYYVAAVRWHPDRAGGNKERFQRMQAAYECVRDARLGRPSRDAPRDASSRPRSWRPGGATGGGARDDDESRARAHREPRAGWGSHEESDDPPDYQQGPRTKHGRWLWKAALAFITARVIILGGMKLAYGDRDREGPETA